MNQLLRHKAKTFLYGLHIIMKSQKIKTSGKRTWNVLRPNVWETATGRSIANNIPRTPYERPTNVIDERSENV